MKFNVGSADRIIRLILGLVLVALFFTGTLQIATTLGIVGAVAAAILIVTGTVSFCPAYSILGLRTRAE